MTNHEHFSPLDKPTPTEIIALLLNGGLDTAIVSICAQASYIKFSNSDYVRYLAKNLDYNNDYLNLLRLKLQYFDQLPHAIITSRESIPVGRITHLTIPGASGEVLDFSVTSAGINNKLNILKINLIKLSQKDS